MKTRLGTLVNPATIAMAVLSTAATLAAQAGPERQSRFILEDLGSLGGPASYVTFTPHPLNGSGTVVGIGDTASPDPFDPIASSTAPRCTRSGGAMGPRPISGRS